MARRNQGFLEAGAEMAAYKDGGEGRRLTSWSSRCLRRRLAFSNKTPRAVQVAYFLCRWQQPNRDAALAIQMPKLHVRKEAAHAAG